MAAIDFITALGRLLQNGALRDAFESDAESFAHEIGLRECDRAALLRLVPADLEFQARVLLRKRFAILQARLPETFRRLESEAWTVFQHYGRSNGSWGKQPSGDGIGFCTHLLAIHPGVVCRVEFNRIRFVESRRWFAFHLVEATPVDRTRRFCVQMLFQHRAKWAREWLFYFAG